MTIADDKHIDGTCGCLEEMQAGVSGLQVLLLGPYPPPHGGVQTNLVAIQEFLSKHGLLCSVINLHRHRTGTGERVYHPSSAIQLLKLMLRLRYNIVHLHIGGEVTGRLLGLSFLCCMLPWAKAILTFHSGGYPTSLQGRSVRSWCLRGIIFRRFDRIIAVNQEIVQLFRRFGVRKERIRLIAPHAIPNIDSNATLGGGLAEFYATHHPVLLSVGLLEPEYDVPLQIEALGILQDKFPRAGLAVIGSGSMEKTLLAMIEETTYRGDIMLCGDVPHQSTIRAITEADVLLRTTWYDGDSVAVREALHLGTPVVASDNGMRPAGVLLIRPRDIQQLSGAVERVVRSSSSTLKTIISKDAFDENLKAVVEVYNEVLSYASCQPHG